MYSFKLKKRLCEEVCLEGASTIRTAEKYGIPLKTLEKWITAYHKNPEYFDVESIRGRYYIGCVESDEVNYNYDEMNEEELIFQLHLRDIELQKLRKCLNMSEI